jgi:hypothetical protein
LQNFVQSRGISFGGQHSHLHNLFHTLPAIAGHRHIGPTPFGRSAASCRPRRRIR